MKKFICTFIIWIALSIGNFLWQSVETIPNYEIGCERSYFQFIACLSMYFLMLIFEWEKS